MNYVITKNALILCGIMCGILVYYRSAGLVNESKKIGNTWFVPTETGKPVYGRYRISKVKAGENK